MAKITDNLFTQGLSGSLRNVVFRHMPDGSTRVSIKSPNKRTFNQEQEGYQSRFQVAVAYAREAKTDPFYAALAQETGRDAYHLAISDSLKSPVIHNIERRDGHIQVTASDNVMVIRVQINIQDRDGKLLEQDYAAQPDPQHDPERWEYASSAEGTVEVTAWDLPSNPTTAVLGPLYEKTADE